ncbi:hypothetical protein [Dyadobacter sp. CY347]|uniref:hypothetical protein n=1 Tax=Dyadobacter sp. CY347 TaxID=2909336 RepID=UPI001F2B5401|nr:hypothetical protein [Dyadobacter sp. CY347]MCF2489947.1 hypothetical protein [Dyadobacter sp. CY347]
MKTTALIKSACLSSIFFLAMAFSCQDHNIPDPEPTASCNLADGTPRAFPCEFEIVKIDFMEKNAKKVMSTATQSDSNVTLNTAHAASFSVYGIQGYFRSSWRTRITLKRIAASSTPGPNEYITRDIRANNEINDPITTPDSNFKKLSFNIAVGDTISFASTVFIEGGYRGGGNYSVSLGYLATIQNVATSALLQKPPYNYTFIQDLAEAKINYFPTIIDQY